MENILEEINKLCLDNLPSDWVESVFYFDFTGFEDIPPEYEAVLDSIEIQNVFENILDNIDQAEDTEEKSWASLSQLFSYRNLLAVVGHYIKHGTENVTERDHRANALLAARVYFRLLLIPGARAYNVYHSQLFAHSIACLGFPKLMCETADSNKSNKRLSEEVNYVLKDLSEYLVDLRDIIFQLKLTPVDINFEEILSNLVDVTGGSITLTLNNIDKILLSSVSDLIYRLVYCMICNYEEQPNSKAIEILFKCMVPKFIATSLDSKDFVRASYVAYAGVILSKFYKASVKSFIFMLEHICYSTELLERSDARCGRANLIVGLMSFLPDRRHRKFVKWILILSTTSRLEHRYLALEIMSKLLNNEPEEQREALRNEIQQDKAATFLNATGTDLTMAWDRRDSQDSQESMEIEDLEDIEEDESVGLHRLAPHTVPFGQILLAVLDCAQDVSSPIRQRALNVLAESVGCNRENVRRELQTLNGPGSVSRLMALAARGLCDERAVVRRSAIGLVLRLLATGESPPSPDNLAVLVRICRDAAITVRSAAISALGDLVMNRTGEAVVDAFLTGPMHQLSDPETKVQDQVKSLIEQIIIKRLVKYTKEGYNDEILPWMFLEGIIKRNMRRNLQNACLMLAKTENCISVRLVDILSSHLGVKDEHHDLQCLVLLTCIARHVDYSDIGFALDYYYNLAKIPDETQVPNMPPKMPVSFDTRLMALTLELLSTWAKFAKAPDRAKLRDHLVQRMTAGVDDGCRIPTMMLTKELDPSNLVWATELMQLSEQRALEDRSISEALRVVDLSLVAPNPPSPAILQLFLAAIKNPPPYWSGVAAGECVAGVGRLCLRARSAAALAAPVLANLLHSNAPLPARINALLALADCSQRYANIVEPLLGTICRCLEAETPTQLRRVAIRSLTDLLLSQFIRLRTPLYYNYFALIADSDHEVREPAEHYVTSCLKVDIIFQNFVDCVLHYNSAGAVKLDFDARQLIYDVMLQRFSLVQRLTTQCRLAREILGHAANLVDDDEELPATLQGAMLDTIKLLIGPRMRLPRKPQQVGDRADIDDLQERVTTNIVSHKMKRTVAEEMLPAVLRLHARLATGGGQLAAYLVMLMQDLMIDYKDEIAELIENDDELVARLASFRENHVVVPTTGNMRNLVTTSGPPEPETPKTQRNRAVPREPVKKRSLKI